MLAPVARGPVFNLAMDAASPAWFWVVTPAHRRSPEHAPLAQNNKKIFPPKWFHKGDVEATGQVAWACKGRCFCRFGPLIFVSSMFGIIS